MSSGDKLAAIVVIAIAIVVSIGMVTDQISIDMVDDNSEKFETKVRALIAEHGEKIQQVTLQTLCDIQMERAVEKGFAEKDVYTGKYRWLNKDVQYVVGGYETKEK